MWHNSSILHFSWFQRQLVLQLIIRFVSVSSVFLIVSIHCCNDVFGQTVYVSSSSGNDENDGLSVDMPVRTLTAGLEKGTTVLLKAGDVFYESLFTNGKRVGRYGDGVNPLLCGYKRIINVEKWEHVDRHIWRLKLSDDNFIGNVKYKGSSFVNNIGCIHEYDKDLIHGRRLQYLKDLSEDWDFWQTERFDKNMPASEFDYIYLYLSTNPQSLKLEFAIRTNAAKVYNTTIENIDFIGFGFGVSCGTETILKNCHIDAIGGRLFVGYSSFTSYGNGIEFYISSDKENCLIEGCHISRCYDCGITIQGSGYEKATPRSIIVRNNLIENCCQGWEDFLRNGDDVLFENCFFEGNIVLNSGNTSGFGYENERFKFCHLLGNNVKGDKGMIIRNNTFVGGNFYCSGAFQGRYQSNVWQDNTCVIRRGDYLLSNYDGTKNVIRIPIEKGEFRTLAAATKDAIKKYRELTGDETTRFIIRTERNIERRCIKLKKQFNNSL